METALTFNDVTLTPVTVDNRIWIRATELATALGYKRVDQVAKIYRTNADEFTPDMTQVIEILDNANSAFSTKARIFSPRGCHLIAMFARTRVAKKFRKWVLDVLDKVCEPKPEPTQAELPATISPAEQSQLHAIVSAKVGMLPREQQRKAYAEAWTRFCRHFRIAKYSQLPSSQMGEAVDYLVNVEWKAAKALPAPQAELPAPAENLPTPMLENAPEALRILHRTRELCRFKMIPKGFSANDREAAERHKLHNDLYMAADNAWAFLWCLHGAMDKLERMM